MKCVTGSEMRAIEREAIQTYGIRGIVLMELAGKGLADKCLKMMDSWDRSKRLLIVAGKGNNGGDGFVAARHLINHNIKVRLALICDPDHLRGDARINFDILMKMSPEIITIAEGDDLSQFQLVIEKSDVIIDAMFGTGFKGVVSGIAGSAMTMINESRCCVISADLPSGIEADSGRHCGICIKADHTLTFGLPKVGLFLEPGASMCGEVEIIDISLPRALTCSDALQVNLMTAEQVWEKLPKRAADGHKGCYGHVYVVGGSIGMTGAVALSCEAALHAGAGLVTAGIPETLNAIMEVKLTEVMTKPLPEGETGYMGSNADRVILDDLRKRSLLAIGPGISTHHSVKELIRKLLPKVEVPLVIDADGLNVISEILIENEDFLNQMQAPVILTPHPGEMARLTGIPVEEIQQNRLFYSAHYARKWGVVLVIKGAHTVVTCPTGDQYINTTGNPGMATAGSGDVLTGVISALIAQGLSPVDAAVAGVQIHGRAGDMAASERGYEGLVAGDLIEHLGAAFNSYKKTMDDG